MTEKKATKKRPAKLTVKQAKFAKGVAAHGNGAKAARDAGYAAGSARITAAQNLANPNISAVVEKEREKLFVKYENALHLLVDAIPDKLYSPFTTMKDVASAIGTITDKMQLLKGEATTIIQTNLTDEQKAQKLAEIINRGKERMRLVK